MHQHEPTEAGAARPRSSARRRTNDREEIALLKEKMRGAVASLGMPRHVTQAALSLIDTWQRGKGLFPEQVTIARGAHYSERRTRDALAELRHTYDLITWENRRYRGVQTSNLYQWTARFWSIVHARAGGATGGNQCRPQAAKMTARRRQPLPTNGDLPFSERSSLNGIAHGPEALATTAPSTAATAPQPSPSPSFSEQQAEGAPADPSPPHPSPEADPAILDLLRLHGERHAEKYGREDAQRGEVYHPGAASCLSAKNRGPVATALRNLAARAHAIALAKNRDDLPLDTLRVELTERIVRAFFEQETPYLRERKHPLGCLWGQGGTDGKPCALLSLAPRVIEQWAEALEPGDAPTLAEILSRAPVEATEHQGEPPGLDTADDADEARAACDELRARAPVELDELDELDAAPDVPELNEARTAEQIRAELERIDVEARARAEHQRAQRSPTRRRDRVRLATRPRERLALLAALRALAAPPATLGDLEHEPHDEGPAAAPCTADAPPLLRDARDRPPRRAPRRRRAPPRRT